MEREVGGGIGMGNTCKPMAVSFQCMTKSTTIKKKEPTRSLTVETVAKNNNNDNNNNSNHQKPHNGSMIKMVFRYGRIQAPRC